MKAFYERNGISLNNSATAPQQAIRRRLRTAKEMVFVTARSIALLTVLGLTGLSVTGEAQLAPQWISRVPVGSALSAGIAGIHVDPDGVSYITCISGLAIQSSCLKEMSTTFRSPTL